MDCAHAAPMIAEVNWEVARSFHGHLGPWLALGLKIGHEAVRRLNAEPHWGLEVKAECRLEPPVSCLLDGLQLGTGATYGKRNIEATQSDAVCVRTVNTESGEGLEFRLRPEAERLFDEWYHAVGEDETAYRVYAAEPSMLYEVVETKAGE